MSDVPSIKKLDQAVVNRIAAGEVIQRPANALKELIENSLDAGSTQIQILIKDGGLKLLQIQDNGHGIRKEDMAIVCERFTTSKLNRFEDLSSIATYGFRGEALASISHVAHVTITTKTADSPCAYRALYSDGRLVPAKPGQSTDPKPCAGNNGTQITAEDLFYNVPTRRKALKSISDEYNRILDVVSRYAVHNSGISFSCRKQGATMADLQTSLGASTIDTIRQLHGSVASELLSVHRDLDELKVKLQGYISNANYSVKKMTLLLFINHRSVESTAIKRAIDAIYSLLLPKGMHPFIYLSLEIDPKNVDVNVHPTKKEVHFLNEDKIIEAISQAFQETLENANQSRTFYTQALLPGASDPTLTPPKETEEALSSISGSSNNTNVPEYKYVRTDSKVTTLDAFVHKPSNTMDRDEPVVVNKSRVEVRLTSVLQLRKEVKKQENLGLSHIFSSHTFIGCVDDRLALVQHEQNIYLIDYNTASEELFYQVVLNEFCNMGELRLATPIPIKDCLKLALDMEEKKGTLPDNLINKQDIITSITDTLVSRAEMLKEYFSMEISAEGELIGLPMLIKDYVPCLDQLPLFLLRLGTEVDWESEKGCFETFSRELALFYSANQEEQQQEEDYLWKVQHLIFPAFKTHFIAPLSLKDAVTPLANLADLYKIFERC
ncbi:MAG: histidine kinase-like ATPase [Benjaminiella poitrasii]|nr:MAG: histidine kinase-like ATPase [Benjaminiella poitrasii]